MRLAMIAGILILLIVVSLLIAWPLRRIKRSRWLLSVAAIVPLLGFLLYMHWGSLHKLEDYWRQQQRHRSSMSYLAKLKNPQQVVEKLQQLLEREPNRPHGWYLLGRLYMNSGAYKKALVAYKHAYDLDQNNIQILTQYVESIVLVKGKLPAILRKHGEIAWKNNPKDYPLAHALSLDDFARQRYVGALHRWENILKILPPGGKDSKMILQWIARAQRKIR